LGVGRNTCWVRRNSDYFQALSLPNAQDQKRDDTSAQKIMICSRLLNLVVGWYLEAEPNNNAP